MSIQLNNTVAMRAVAQHAFDDSLEDYMDAQETMESAENALIEITSMYKDAALELGRARAAFYTAQVKLALLELGDHKVA